MIPPPGSRRVSIHPALPSPISLVSRWRAPAQAEPPPPHVPGRWGHGRSDARGGSAARRRGFVQPPARRGAARVCGYLAVHRPAGARQRPARLSTMHTEVLLLPPGSARCIWRQITGGLAPAELKFAHSRAHACMI
eukprot:scaffold1374_cov115-Isochrysis_galbana.AAC.4